MLSSWIVSSVSVRHTHCIAGLLGWYVAPLLGVSSDYFCLAYIHVAMYRQRYGVCGWVGTSWSQVCQRNALSKGHNIGLDTGERV